MKTPIKTILSIALISFASCNLNAQIKIKKPTINVKTPKIGDNPTDVSIPSKDPSGLFSNCTDDPSANSHRRNAVENLESMENEFKNESVNYPTLINLISKNEKTLGFIVKLEPKVNADKYNERYNVVKKRADEEIIIYNKVKELEKVIAKEYSAPMDANKPHIPSYQSYFSFQKECYCSRQEQTKSFQEYNAIKKEYEELTSKLIGYTNEITQNYFTRMAECVEGGNKYALWVAKENLKIEVIIFNEREKPLKPESVVEKCSQYANALILIEKDKSLDLSTEAKTALTEAKKQVAEIKTEAERYISSGDFEKYKAKVHAEKIAKEFLPKAVATNATLTSGAMKFVKGERMKNYLAGRLNHSPVASTLRANLMTEKPLISKNALDIPQYKYHEIWVAYKDTEGRCLKVLVYAEYNYLGGGQYESTPTYTSFGPIEMACENVNK